MTTVPIGAVVLLCMILTFPLVIQFSVRWKCSGRMLCGIVGKDKPLSFKLLKVDGGEFVKDGKDQWLVVSEQIKLVRFPLMWPGFLNMFTQTVPCSLYMRGRSDPLDWDDPEAGALSSKELPEILDPHWLVALVRGVTEGTGLGKRERVLLFLAVGASIVCLLLIFVVLYQIGQLGDVVNSLKVLVR